MLRLPKKMLFALEAVVDVAYNARPDPVQSREITKRQGIPARYLEQVMQQLVHSGILKGVRGPKGGYTLARERRKITVADVLKAVASLDHDGEGRESTEGSELGRLVVRPLWEEVEEEITRRLSAVTMEDLCRKATELGVPGGGQGKSTDFSI